MQYYIHNKANGYVGNSMVWWAKDHHGYTCDIRQAHVFDKSELHVYLTLKQLIAYPVDDVNKNIVHHVEHVDSTEPVTGKSLEPAKPFYHNTFIEG